MQKLTTGLQAAGNQTKKVFTGGKARYLVFVGVFALIGAAIIIFTRAATPSASIEAENGSLAGGAKVINDSSASSNKAVEFTNGSGISVSGSKVLKDGQEFYVKGFNSIALLRPDGCNVGNQVATKAKDLFAQSGSNELDVAKTNWGVNTVRFQLSERGLGTNDFGLTNKTNYINRIKAGVTLARSKGLVVIVSVQGQSYSCPAQDTTGKNLIYRMPSSRTSNAWAEIAPLFKGDPYIIYELFNEPEGGITQESWGQWRNGGTVQGFDNNLGSGDVVGHQTILNQIRSTIGASNTIVVDGISQHLDGMIPGPDTVTSYALNGSNVIYSVHPYYFHANANSSITTDRNTLWQKRSGFALDSGYAVVFTEWNANSKGICIINQGDVVDDFISWIRDKKIGIVIHALDVENTVVKELSGWTPTTLGIIDDSTDDYCNGSDSTPARDAGKLLQNYFKNGIVSE